MPINVNNPEADALTRRFAKMAGVGITDAIVRSANTSKIGDGKVFVLDLEQALRIRTGETAEAAI